jgi:hypothetical protein
LISLLLHPVAIAHFSGMHRQKGQFFLCTGILCPAILILNYLNLYKYSAKADFGTDIAKYFRI